jgi:hypothetical protein
MRARALSAGLAAISIVVVAGPASGKVESITEANITGPGLEGGLRIEVPDTEGLWESGIDVSGGLDDTRADSVEELGLTPVDLGYLVTYRFDGDDDLIRQDLYPYAKGGPVTHTPPGQELTPRPERPAGLEIPMLVGWYQSSLGFFHYLVDHGLPEGNPVAAVATREPAPVAAPGTRTVPWAGVVVALLGLAAVSMATSAVRRRLLAVSRVNRWAPRRSPASETRRRSAPGSGLDTPNRRSADNVP